MGEIVTSNASEVVEEVLRSVEVPGFDIDLISGGVVRSFRISKDGEKVVVFVDFLSADPRCLFCKFINHTLWRSISAKIKEALIKAGFKEVFVIDMWSKQEL